MKHLVDIFAGAGGWSHGWRMATGSEPLLAVNHCAHAVHLHRLNHPGTEHHLKDVWEVDPRTAIAGRRVDWLHGSPDCTHHSRAKGGKPREQKIRALADVLIDWARESRAPVVSLENVIEWLDWGPLDDAGHPIKERRGECFREWLAKLRALGYVVDWRVLCAADFGALTIRKRLFLIARRDGLPICWPAPTHANPAKRDLFTGGLGAPAPAVVTKARHGLVTVEIDGTDYVLADIGLRMLSPRELARAQGFPDSYVLEGTKSEQIARVGNSVCPAVAAAIVRANVAPAEAVVA